MVKINQRPGITLILVAVSTLCLLYVASTSTNFGVECAPAKSNGKTNSNNNKNNANKSSNNRLVKPGLLRNLFRRQNPSSGSSSSSSSDADEASEAQTQTEIDAQKFIDSLPNPGTSSSGPSSFRERVTDTFGLLRDGVGNQFRSLKDNFSETVDDLRETWSSGQD